MFIGKYLANHLKLEKLKKELCLNQSQPFFQKKLIRIWKACHAAKARSSVINGADAEEALRYEVER